MAIATLDDAEVAQPSSHISHEPKDITSLASKVQQLSQQISTSQQAASTSTDLSDNLDYQSLVSSLTATTQRLLLTVQPPKAFFQSFQLAQYDIPPWQLAVEFNLFSAIPKTQSTDSHAARLSSSEISRATDGAMDAELVGRVLRLLALQGVFQNVGEDLWSHSALSEFLATNSEVRAALAMQLDEFYAAGSSAAGAVNANKASKNGTRLKKSTTESTNGTNGTNGKDTHGAKADSKDEGETSADSKDAKEQNITPFQQRFGEPIYSFYNSPSQQARSARFGEAMAGAAFLDSASLADMRSAYPWDKLPAGTVVDVGGGQGQLCMTLAETNPHLNFLVQDIFPPSEETLAAATPQRVSFQTHDFFQQQPDLPSGSSTPSAYLLKHVLHNHVSSSCVTILKHLAAALNRAPAGTRLLIAEGVVGHKSNTWLQERTLARGDLCMWITLGAKERTLGEFEALCREADGRMRIVGVWGKGVTKLVEVMLEV